MGYYSTVGIAMRTKDYEAMCELAKKEDKSGFHLNFIQEGRRQAPDRENDYTLLYWGFVKWGVNSSSEFIMDFLDNIEDDHYDFLRIGENYDDYDIYYGTQEYLLEYQRDVNFDVPL